jgi:hypothetical protein
VSGATRVWPRRSIAAGLSGAAGVPILLALSHDAYWKVLLPVVALVSAAIVVLIPRLGPQLFARAVFWSNLGLGAILCLLGSGSETWSGFELAAACGIALLVVGRKGLAEGGERDAYAPAAFRSSLLLLMVLALADAQTFLLFGILNMDGADGARFGPHVSALLLTAGAVLAVGFIGLYRVELWGAALNVGTCVAVLIVAGAGLIQVDDKVRKVVCALSALHVLVASPMLLSLFTKRRLPSPSPRVRGIAASAVIVGALLVCAVALMLHG